MPPTKVQNPPGSLQTERLQNGNRKLIRDLTVELDDGTKVTVRTGFETDFSSIPWFARSLVDWTKVDIAGVVHDYLYWCRQNDISRKRADAIWLEMAGAGEHAANAFQRWLAWVGLRLGGWWAHRKARLTSEFGRRRRCTDDGMLDDLDDIQYDSNGDLLINASQWAEFSPEERIRIEELLLALGKLTPAIRIAPGPNIPRMPSLSVCKLACRLGGTLGGAACAELKDSVAAAICMRAVQMGEKGCLKLCK